MSWFVYALYNQESKKIYIGQTNNIGRRLLEHNQKKGNHFTAKVLGEWKLVYKEEFEIREEAIRREKQLKSFRGREFLKNLI
ncbi:GIY-YIG nuclease family protein [Candidatus Microgenomates bacterium]|nr:GIY-YIG nuclease family protein [Candidatus Microgenomates bacterium]